MSCREHICKCLGESFTSLNISAPKWGEFHKFITHPNKQFQGYSRFDWGLRVPSLQEFNSSRCWRNGNAWWFQYFEFSFQMEKAGATNSTAWCCFVRSPQNLYKARTSNILPKEHNITQHMHLNIEDEIRKAWQKNTENGFYLFYTCANVLRNDHKIPLEKCPWNMS